MIAKQCHFCCRRPVFREIVLVNQAGQLLDYTPFCEACWAERETAITEVCTLFEDPEVPTLPTISLTESLTDKTGPSDTTEVK